MALAVRQHRRRSFPASHSLDSPFVESKPGGEEAALLRAAIAAANAGEHDTALAHLQRLVELQPQHELGCGMLGALHAQQGRGEAAAPWFERTLALNPDNVLARFQLGLLALQSGRFQDALDRWAPMLALEEDFMAHFHSAVALPVDDILNDAVNVMERYIGHEPEVVERLQSILRNARDIKELIQKVGQKMAPAQAHPDVEKTAGDMVVPFERLPESIDLYRSTLERHGLDYAIWGHVSDGNLHPNVVPSNFDDVRRGREAILEIARAVVALGGAPLAEHGVGRSALKQQLLRELYGSGGVAQMRAVKRALDPEWKLAPGVLF